MQTSGTVTPTRGELGSETDTSRRRVLAIRDDNGQIRSESGGYELSQRNLVLGPGGGSLDAGAWIAKRSAGGTVSGRRAPWPSSALRTPAVIDNPSATWIGGTSVRGGTLSNWRGGSNGLSREPLQSFERRD